jgi:transposase InsO family protein
MAQGIPVIEHAAQVCDTCVTTKMCRQSFPQKAAYRAEQPLELVHGDLCGPITPATPGGRRYFLLMVDDATRFMFVALLATKDEAAQAVKKIKARAEKETGREFKVLQTDNGGEFTCSELAEYFAMEGVKHHFSTPHSPQQNGIVEWRNQTVVATAWALLKPRGMPARFWGEVVVTAVHLLNRSPTKSLQGMTPYEAWHGRAPSVAHLRVFGCVSLHARFGAAAQTRRPWRPRHLHRLR